MAPRKKNAAIKSTGSTSSKSEPLPDWVKDKTKSKPPPKHLIASTSSTTTTSTSNGDSIKPPPLFPPGTKTPINLLHEKVQKQGWLKPIIDARKIGKSQQDKESFNDSEQWTFIVTLQKINKSDQSNPFSLRFDSRDPSGFEGSNIILDSKEKAKHWGATYTLFRLYSNLSLDQILPTGPKEYWKVLLENKSKAPDHLNWLWSNDPFEIHQKQIAAKQLKEQQKERDNNKDKHVHIPKIWTQAKEVRMSKEIREQIENVISEAMKFYSGQENQFDNSKTLSNHLNEESIIKNLIHLGFRLGHIQSAIKWLKNSLSNTNNSSPLFANLKNLSPQNACIEYLSIFCPEDDLPKSFKPKESFINLEHSQESNLAERWIQDRLVHNAGFPRLAVENCSKEFKEMSIEVKEALMIDKLLLKLIGKDKLSISSNENSSQQVKEQARIDERITLEAILGSDRIIEIPSSERPLTGKSVDQQTLYDIIISKKPNEDIRLRICPGIHSNYPSLNSNSIPTFFITSNSLPAYLKLSFTKRLCEMLFNRKDWIEILSQGQGGIILSMVEEIESCWKDCIQHPPELSKVMTGFINEQEKFQSNSKTTEKVSHSMTIQSNRKNNLPPPLLQNNEKQNAELKAIYTEMLQSEEFNIINKQRQSLPANQFKSEINKILSNHRILIITGETGCGKTTQCPQFVLDDFLEKGKGSLCNIIVTQPRRLSAMGVASRVAQERCELIDGKGLIGYSIRGESKLNKNTKLLFTTTGVLLRRLSGNDSNLDGISHVFIDEVHERNVDSDLLLTELRQVIQKNKNLRIILMSATIEKETFINYFPGAPTMHIPGRTFPVIDYYLDDIKGFLEEEQGQVDNDNDDLIGHTVNLVCNRAKDNQGSILIFMSGVGEIQRAINSISKIVKFNIEIIPLHANLSPQEQRKVFQKSSFNKRKIIVSTNVAETSITIDDVIYVIDSGLVKEMQYDQQSGLTKLVEVRCSKANANQRRGRAGRVKQGECFKLYTKGTEQYRMASQQTPEMLRIPLENLLLTIKSLKGDSISIKDYLQMTISPPNIESIDNAIKILIEMNILSKDQKLSALGKHISLLPLDVRLAKMLILGYVFHCLGSMLTAAAILSSKSLFSAPLELREEAKLKRMNFLIGNSDILTDINAYNQSKEKSNSWCRDHFISSSIIRDITLARLDLLNDLIEMGLINKRQYDSILDENSNDINLQRALLIAALYPSIVKIAPPSTKFDKAISGTVEREIEAKQVRYFDENGNRVFLHPSSLLFNVNKYQSGFLASFRKGVTQNKGGNADKILLRDATEVSSYALLLFGGQLNVHHQFGGISISKNDESEGWMKLRANARIAALIDQLRFLLDAALSKSFEDPTIDIFSFGIDAKVRDCLRNLIENDGL